MAYKAYRLRQKNAEGTYDILLISSRSDLVQRFKDGAENGTVESALQSLESTVKTLSDGLGGIDLSVKADKVSGATNGNFAGLDSNGNLTDSGKKAADFAAATHDHGIGEISGTANSVVILGSDGKLAVSTVVSLTELNYLDGVTSGIQAQLNAIKSTADGASSDLSKYVPLTQKGANNGVVPLNANGLIDATYLPSYVDDVIEGYLSGGKFYEESAHTTEITGESGKIYVDLSTEKTYRWSGSAFVVISDTIALGETETTAYRGDRGKIAYEHSQATHARTDATAVTYKSNGVLTINGSDTTIYTHPTYNTTKSTDTQTLTKGGTFTALSAITASNGHVTGYTEKTFTLPSAGIDISFAANQPTTQAEGDLWFESIS